jgi:hypothetical protein
LQVQGDYAEDNTNNTNNSNLTLSKEASNYYLAISTTVLLLNTTTDYVLCFMLFVDVDVDVVVDADV